MPHVRRLDDIRTTVVDLESVTVFFVGPGLEVEGTGSVEGECGDTVFGIPGAHCRGPEGIIIALFEQIR